jgi:hypothetical protein
MSPSYDSIAAMGQRTLVVHPSTSVTSALALERLQMGSSSAATLLQGTASMRPPCGAVHGAAAPDATARQRLQLQLRDRQLLPLLRRCLLLGRPLLLQEVLWRCLPWGGLLRRCWPRGGSRTEPCLRTAEQRRYIVAGQRRPVLCTRISVHGCDTH